MYVNITKYDVTTKELKLKSVLQHSEFLYRLTLNIISEHYEQHLRHRITTGSTTSSSLPEHSLNLSASLWSFKRFTENCLSIFAVLPGIVEQYCVGSEQGRAVRLEGRMISHSKPRQHGLSSIWDMPAQYNGLIRIMVVVTGLVFLQVILSICTLNTIQYLQVFFVRGVLWCRQSQDRSYFCLFIPHIIQQKTIMAGKSSFFMIFTFMKYVYFGCFYPRWSIVWATW